MLFPEQSQFSRVFEEYSNIMSRISATADLSASSVNALSESFKKLNRELGGSRTDLMKGVYTAIQANFTRPSEFMPIGEAAMRLRTASGREIDTQKSADVISVVRNALGVRSGREGAITDMLLRGRDIGDMNSRKWLRLWYPDYCFRKSVWRKTRP
jgi:hypothetical protein